MFVWGWGAWIPPPVTPFTLLLSLITLKCLILSVKVLNNGGEETSSEDYERENEHTQRIQAISRQDPVHTTSLRTYLAQKLKVFESQVGVEAVSTLFQTLEEDCKRLLREITSV